MSSDTMSFEPPSTPRQWHQEVIRQQYNDPQALKDQLDKIYGPGNWKVRIMANRWILSLPKPFEEGERAKLERRISFHYNDNDSDREEQEEQTNEEESDESS